PDPEPAAGGRAGPPRGPLAPAARFGRPPDEVGRRRLVSHFRRDQPGARSDSLRTTVPGPGPHAGPLQPVVSALRSRVPVARPEPPPHKRPRQSSQGRPHPPTVDLSCLTGC